MNERNGVTAAERFLAAIKDAVERDGVAVVLPLTEAADKLSWRYFYAGAKLEGKESPHRPMSVRAARRIKAEVEADILRHTEGAPYRLDVPGVGPLFEENGLAAAAGESCEYSGPDGPDEPTWVGQQAAQAVA